MVLTYFLRGIGSSDESSLSPCHSVRDSSLEGIRVQGALDIRQVETRGIDDTQDKCKRERVMESLILQEVTLVLQTPLLLVAAVTHTEQMPASPLDRGP
jgi:hypothetical protein